MSATFWRQIFLFRGRRLSSTNNPKLFHYRCYFEAEFSEIIFLSSGKKNLWNVFGFEKCQFGTRKSDVTHKKGALSDPKGYHGCRCVNLTHISRPLTYAFNAYAHILTCQKGLRFFVPVPRVTCHVVVIDLWLVFAKVKGDPDRAQGGLFKMGPMRYYATAQKNAWWVS